MRVVAELLTLTGRVTVRVAEQVNVSVGVSAHKTKERTAPAAVVVTTIAALPATASRVANEQVNQIRRQPKESIHEGASHNTTPVVADKTVE